MTNFKPEPHDQETEVLYWLDLAKRILGGDISPSEALQILKSEAPYVEASDAKDGPRP